MNKKPETQQYKNLDFVRISRERYPVLIMACNAEGVIGVDDLWKQYQIIYGRLKGVLDDIIAKRVNGYMMEIQKIVTFGKPKMDL